MHKLTLVLCGVRFERPSGSSGTILIELGHPHEREGAREMKTLLILAAGVALSPPLTLIYLAAAIKALGLAH
jgi:hypothetical protein